MKVLRSASRTGRLYHQDHGAVGRKYVTKSPVTPPGIDPGTALLVAQRLNHYATPGPLHYRCKALSNISQLYFICKDNGKGKGTGHPITGHEGPEVE
jgi:hypothetical protein